jgi:hypothetical protein
MMGTHEQLYLRTLHELVAARIVFGVLGTFALRCQVPALPRRLVADCDIQLPFEMDNLTRLVCCLQAAGWEVRVWDEPVALPLSAGQLAGKYYLRARKAGAVLDCTYENALLGWPEFRARCHWQQGLPLLKKEDVLRQKALVNRPADQRVLHWVQQARSAAR